MDRDQLLRLMDLNWVEMTREITRTTPGGFIVERGGVVVCGTPDGTVVSNMAMVVGPTDAGHVRGVVEDLFVRAGIPGSVWLREHDAGDAALAPELEACGFFELMQTPAMSFHGGDGSPIAPPAELRIEAVADEAGCRAYGALMAAAFGVYGVPTRAMTGCFERLESLCGPTIQGYLGFVDDRPVAGATLYVSHDVGGIGFVGTHPDHFKRGYGAAVTWAVVEDGLRRGVRFMNLQASPMGAPVYRRMGFQMPTRYRTFVLAG